MSLESIAFAAARRGALILIAAALSTTHVGAADQPKPTDSVVAERGGAVLTLGEIDAKVRTMPPELRAGFLTDPDRIARLVDSMLLAEQVALEAAKKGLDKDPEYQADTALLGTELLSGRLVRDYMESVKTPNFDNLAHERYLADAKQFTPPPKIEYRQVLLSTDGRDEASAQAVAQKILDRTKAGEDFETVVAEFAKTEGKYLASGTVESADLDRLDTKFAIALHGLKKVGDLAGPVRSRFGFHVIRLASLETFPTPSFDEVKDGLVAEMRNRFLEEEKNRFFNRYSQLDTKLSHDVIGTLPGRYSKAVAEAQATAETASAEAPKQP